MWPSGQAEVCKTSYAGSNPAITSNKNSFFIYSISMKDKTSTIGSYDRNAINWKKQKENGLIQHDYIEKPAMYSLLPNLEGMNILCIGVGTGEEITELQRRGANITAIDLSEGMLNIARENYQNVRFLKMDMHELDFDDEEFDFVYSSLTVHYSHDWETVLTEVSRVLKTDGVLLFSSTHPIAESYSYTRTPEKKTALIGRSKDILSGEVEYYGDYLTEKTLTTNWGGDDFIVEFQHKTISSIIECIIKSGFILTNLLEPLPLDGMKEIDPIKYERYCRIPGFIVFNCRKNNLLK